MGTAVLALYQGTASAVPHMALLEAALFRSLFSRHLEAWLCIRHDFSRTVHNVSDEGFGGCGKSREGDEMSSLSG